MIKREDIQYRIGQTIKDKNGMVKGVVCLVYIDARVVYDELDSKFGADKWSFDWQYIPGEHGVKGIITAISTPDYEHITRSDVGYPNDAKITNEGEATGEWLKDAVSDSVKRSAVQFGIGRELYSAPFLYTSEVNVSDDGKKVIKKKNEDGSYGEFTVTGRQVIEGNIDKWYSKLSKG